MSRPEKATMKTKELQIQIKNSMGTVSLGLCQGVNEDLSDVIVQRRPRVAGGFGRTGGYEDRTRRRAGREEVSLFW